MDKLDRELLDLLRTDARRSMADLGRSIGLSRTATLARIRRLEEQGVIRGYRADINEASPPNHQARVAIVVRTPDNAAFLRRLAQLPELEEVESIAGEYDFLARFSCDSAERLDEILDRIMGWRETLKTTTFVILKRHAPQPPR